MGSISIAVNFAYIKIIANIFGQNLYSNLMYILTKMGKKSVRAKKQL